MRPVNVYRPLSFGRDEGNTMSNPRSEILVSVRDKASAALRNIGKRLGVLNNPRLGAAMQNLRDKTSAASGTLAMYSAGAVAAGAADALLLRALVRPVSLVRGRLQAGRGAAPRDGTPERRRLRQ